MLKFFRVITHLYRPRGICRCSQTLQVIIINFVLHSKGVIIFCIFNSLSTVSYYLQKVPDLMFSISEKYYFYLLLINLTIW